MSPPEVLSGDVWLTNGPDSVAPDFLDRRGLSERSQHRTILGGCLVIIGLACLLEVRPDQRIQFRFGPEWALPESCGSKILLGRECPGCGLTRGLIWLSRGRVEEAWRLNRMSGFIAAWILAQIPYRVWALADLRDRQRRGLILPQHRWPLWCLWTCAIGLFVSWGLKQLGI